MKGKKSYIHTNIRDLRMLGIKTSLVHFKVGLRKLLALHFRTVDCWTWRGGVDVWMLASLAVDWWDGLSNNTVSRTKYEGHVLNSTVLVDAVFSENLIQLINKINFCFTNSWRISFYSKCRDARVCAPHCRGSSCSCIGLFVFGTAAPSGTGPPHSRGF